MGCLKGGRQVNASVVSLFLQCFIQTIQTHFEVMAATTDDPLNRLVAFDSLDLRPFDERRHRVARVSIHW